MDLLMALDDTEWDVPFPPAPRAPGEVEFYQDNAGKWRWREVAANGRIIADSGQGYATKWNAKRAWLRAARIAEVAR